ncbi:MAG TPA: hypothetical protein VHD33_02155 [Legionellaceae bacterium]|nr:hypothetical protein [Legionellaceae bacterium]
MTTIIPTITVSLADTNDTLVLLKPNSIIKQNGVFHEPASKPFNTGMTVLARAHPFTYTFYPFAEDDALPEIAWRQGWIIGVKMVNKGCGMFAEPNKLDIEYEVEFKEDEDEELLGGICKIRHNSGCVQPFDIKSMEAIWKAGSWVSGVL